MRELLALGRRWLEEARAVMFVDDLHNQTCETACLDCLLTFDAQMPMEKGLLQRKLAIQILDALLHGHELPRRPHGGEKLSHAPGFMAASLANQETLPPPSHGKSFEERLQRASQRMAARESRRKRGIERE